MEIEPKLNSVQ